jgi:hypothetical protein
VTSPDRRTIALAAAAVTAVVTVTAAVIVLVTAGGSGENRRSAVARATPPGVTWTLDAAQYLGRPFGEFSDPRGGASFGSGTTGFVATGDTLITPAGSPTSDYRLDDAVMIGIDADTGRVRWRTPAADLEGCGGTPVSGKLVCYGSTPRSGRDIVTYDVATGASSRRTIPEFVFGITTTGDAVYVAEGDPEDGDVRVHSGTVGNISANWTRFFDLSAGWDGVYEDQVLSVVDGVGLVRIGGQLAQFAADSGAERWRSTDYRVNVATLEPGGVLVESETDTPSGTKVVEQRMRAPDGRVRASTTVPTVQRFDGQRDGRSDRPVLIGDAAYERGSGKQLWRSGDLAPSERGGPGTVTAVTDNVVYLRDPQSSETGLDLRSGKRLWRNASPSLFTPLAAKDDVVVGSDMETLTSFDTEHGRVLWTLPFRTVDPDPDTFRSGGTMVSHGDGWVFSSDRRIIGLDV